jgi:hypothetical protein
MSRFVKLIFPCYILKNEYICDFLMLPPHTGIYLFFLSQLLSGKISILLTSLVYPSPFVSGQPVGSTFGKNKDSQFVLNKYKCWIPRETLLSKFKSWQRNWKKIYMWVERIYHSIDLAIFNLSCWPTCNRIITVGYDDIYPRWYKNTRNYLLRYNKKFS